MKRINFASDIDGVEANWIQAVIDRAYEKGAPHGLPKTAAEVTYWIPTTHKGIRNVLDTEPDWGDFLLNKVQPLYPASQMIVKPRLWVTHRPAEFKEITQLWLRKHGRPDVPVIPVPDLKSKFDVLKEHNIELFVDDNAEVFEDLNSKGIKCLLMNQGWNQDIDAGNLRIYHVSEVANFI